MVFCQIVVASEPQEMCDGFVETGQ
jgi:hypothetical protein